MNELIMPHNVGVKNALENMKEVYGYIIWYSLFLASIFLLCDIPAVRTNIRKVPLWPVLAIEYLSRKNKNGA